MSIRSKAAKAAQRDARIVLDHLAQRVFVHCPAVTPDLFRVPKAGVAASAFSNLPLNVGGAPCGFGRQRRVGEHFQQRGDTASARFAQRWPDRADSEASDLLIGGRAHQNLVAIWASVSSTTPLASIQPEMGGGVVVAAHHRLVLVVVLLFDIGVGVDAHPRAALFRDHHFAADLHLVDLLRSGDRAKCRAMVTRRAVARGPAMGFTILLRLLVGVRGPVQAHDERQCRKNESTKRRMIAAVSSQAKS